jgi:hypothetical protein
MTDFDEIELLLSQLLSASTPVLSEPEKAEVQHYIDVGEYGLALETAADIYAEQGKIATVEAVDLFRRLAIAMDMEAAPLLEKLPK